MCLRVSNIMTRDVRSVYLCLNAACVSTTATKLSFENMIAEGKTFSALILQIYF